MFSPSNPPRDRGRHFCNERPYAVCRVAVNPRRPRPLRDEMCRPAMVDLVRLYFVCIRRPNHIPAVLPLQSCTIVAMTVKQVLSQLQSLGDEARRVHNARHGAGDNQFGVKLGDIRTLARKLKTDYELALKLWDTGNVDAQLLATLIMEPQSLSANELDRMTRSVTFTQVADWLNAYVVKDHPEKESLREKWMKAKDRWAARAGWNLTASRVNEHAGDLDLPALLERIETEMPKARPEVQWTMNNTLAAIGIHHAKHRKRAIAIGEKIGLYRDWPVSKGCTPPYVPVWIEEMVKRAR
jgi:3-methyladenine DNA glycosylase AlkD